MARPAGHLLNREAFQDLMHSTGLSISQVAERASVPRSTVSALLGGHSRAATPNAHKIAAAIGCRPGTIFPTLLPEFQATPKAEVAA